MKKYFILICLSILGLNLFSASAQKPAKILMVIASTNFRDEEYKIPKQYFLQHHNRVITASTKLTPAKGMLGLIIRPDMLISNVNVKDFDALVLPGGTGVTEFWTNKQIFKIINQFASQQKIIAAECLSPMTLAKAGILNSKRATAFLSIKNDLRKYGCLYTGKSVTADLNIITSKGPKSAAEFASVVLKKIRAKQQ